ncbi:UNVERIFIED_CONTAM: hypothetical protein GTU68_053377 [Idotea baltica]|nr:hypothetical protein [Idotea baltica]
MIDYLKKRNNLSTAKFKLKTSFKPSGDQPKAISKINENLQNGEVFQTLLGVTGSGKTFSMANIIAKQGRPTLIIAPNKTLAAQLYAEFKEFFPENAVSYFVSYYDYYQPEAYIPSTDTFIEKDASINDEIDKMRHSATRSILERRDTIVVASVSCIYGLGAPEDYFKFMLYLKKGDEIDREDLLIQLVKMQYTRTDLEFIRGNFRVRGDTVDIFPSDQDINAIRIIFFGDEVEDIQEIDSITGKTLERLEEITIYPLSHFVSSPEKVQQAMTSIRSELTYWLPKLKKENKELESERIKQRTLYDLELLKEVGFCPGVENYSRHLAQRSEGSAPTTLIDYFPDDFLLIIDESHVTVSQLGAMYKGDQSRKQTLVDYGFRLPSAKDNRPLNQEEFWDRVGQTIFTSATPGDFELERSQGLIVEQVNRPTGLLDPLVDIRPAKNQVDDLINEINKVIEKGERVLVTTLTKKMSEDLSSYLKELNIKARYLHSEINTIERVEILKGLRKGDFDVLIGINLLREGLDLVEVSLVAILDADKEGFLRSTKSLIQTMGRAARNQNGRVILYADKITKSMKAAIDETDRRRAIQAKFNQDNNIIPESAKSSISSLIEEVLEDKKQIILAGEQFDIPDDRKSQQSLVFKLRKDMFDAASKREFEKAAELRDAIKLIQERLLLS